MWSKLGLAGGVLVAWLVMFLVMGGSLSLPGVAASPKTANDDVEAAASSVAKKVVRKQAAPPVSRSVAELPKIEDAQVLVPRPKAVRVPEAPPVLTFTLSTYNIEGSSHRGDGPGRLSRGYNGYVRGVDVIGFQEMQPNQRSRFLGMTGGSYGLYPNNSLRTYDGDNSIGWRTDKFELVKADSLSIPYFGGRPYNMPLLLLKDKETGLLAYFGNFHNPGDTAAYGRQGGARAAAKRAEVREFNRIQATGIPLFITGDFNEDDAFYCQVIARTGMVAAAGGGSGCRPPGGYIIDWIAGTSGVDFSGYRVFGRYGPGLRGITDHPIMRADASVDSADFPKAQTLAPEFE